MRHDNIDYIFTSDFDNSHGTLISNQFPLSLYSEYSFQALERQLEGISEIAIPAQLHKSIETESWVYFPLFIEPLTGRLSYFRVDETYQRCILMTVSIFQHDSSYRNGTASSIGIITRLQNFLILKPLLIILLHFYLRSGRKTFVNLISARDKLNQLPLLPLARHFHSISDSERCLLMELLNRGKDISRYVDHFALPCFGGVISASIDVNGMAVPLKMDLVSHVLSPSLCYGSSKSGSVMRSSLERLQSFGILVLQAAGILGAEAAVHCKPILPYLEATSPILLTLLALTMQKRVIVHCYQSPINDLVDFVLSIFILFPSLMPSSDWFGNCYPSLEISHCHLLNYMPSYLVGTSNILFKTKKNSGQLLWDVFIDLDEGQITVNDLKRDSSRPSHQSNRSSIMPRTPNFLKRLSSGYNSKRGSLATTLNDLSFVNPDDLWRTSTKNSSDTGGFQFHYEEFRLTKNATRRSLDDGFLKELNGKLKDHEEDSIVCQTVLEYISRLRHNLVQLCLFNNLLKIDQFLVHARLSYRENEFQDEAHYVQEQVSSYVTHQRLLFPLSVLQSADLSDINSIKHFHISKYYHRVASASNMVSFQPWLEERGTDFLTSHALEITVSPTDGMYAVIDMAYFLAFIQQKGQTELLSKFEHDLHAITWIFSRFNELLDKHGVSFFIGKVLCFGDGIETLEKLLTVSLFHNANQEFTVFPFHNANQEFTRFNKKLMTDDIFRNLICTFLNPFLEGSLSI